MLDLFDPEASSTNQKTPLKFRHKTKMAMLNVECSPQREVLLQKNINWGFLPLGAFAAVEEVAIVLRVQH